MNKTEARKVSVLIPVYNVEAYLPQCLDSVVGQTYRNLEILIADDGATDGCGAICDAYAARDPRISVFHKQNEGLLMTRRFLFARATGDLVLCVDSDDYLKPEAIETAVAYLTRVDADMTIFCYETVDENNRFLSRRPPVWADGTVFEQASLMELRKEIISGGAINSLWEKLFKRELLRPEDDENPLYHTIAFGEDVVQLLPLLGRVNRAVFCDQALYQYRFRHTSISNAYKLKNHTDLVGFMEERQRYLHPYGLSQEYVQTVFLPFVYHSFVKLFYPIGTSRQYSNEELTAHFRKLRESELIQQALKLPFPSGMNVADKTIAWLYREGKYDLLIWFLRLEKRAVAVRDAMHRRKR